MKILLMKKIKKNLRGSYICNCSRGGLVDEDALFKKLKNKNLRLY